MKKKPYDIFKTSVNFPQHIADELEDLALNYGVKKNALVIWFVAEGIARHKATLQKELHLSEDLKKGE